LQDFLQALLAFRFVILARVGHFVSRGKPKPKISDISRTPPTREEYDALADALDQGGHQPVTAAILGAVLVEHQLDIVLQTRLKCGDELWKELISDIGPLRGFHAKILLGRVLRAYNEDLRFNLDIVRNIRNQFAHSKKLVSFDNPLVIREVNKAKQIPGERKHFRYVNANRFGTQYAYISLCMLLTTFLLRSQTKLFQAKTRYYKKRVAKNSAVIERLLKVLAPPTDAQKLPQLSSLPTPTADPMLLAPRGSPSVLLQSLAKDDDKKGK
jgi:hypothetical protein